MYVSKKNEKIGDGALIISRPVGTTCPRSCPFLNNGCYAEQTEKRFPHVKPSSFRNILPSVEELTHLFNEGKPVRLHERGDFLLNGRLHTAYVNRVKQALMSAKCPTVWTYTHHYSPKLAELQEYGLQVYASVHSVSDIRKAKEAGFRLLAYILPDRKKKGGSKDYPPRVNLPIIGKTLVCPEQRLGRSKITCMKCGWCIKGRGNVAFLTH